MIRPARPSSARRMPGRFARAALSLTLAAALGWLPRMAHADGLARLHAFMQDTRSGHSAFTQQVLTREGRHQPEVVGTLAFLRPGRFRWETSKPYQQLVVADGQAVWIWDADLNQATRKAQDKALGASPAALLAGDNARLDADFRLRNLPDDGGLEWVEATPRGGDAGFDSIRLGFAGAALARMDLRDSFGQLTQIRFAGLQAGAVKPSDFQFRPPAGADVVRE